MMRLESHDQREVAEILRDATAALPQFSKDEERCSMLVYTGGTRENDYECNAAHAELCDKCKLFVCGECRKDHVCEDEL